MDLFTASAKLFAQTSYSYSTQTSSGGGGISIVLILLYIAVIVLMLVSSWKIYEKAGKPGWASIVPIYNVYVELQIIGRPTWWILLLFIPFVNIIVSVICGIDLAKSFGKSTGFGILTLFFPFVTYPILAFGSATYVGPAGLGGVSATVPVSPMPLGGNPVQASQQPTQVAQPSATPQPTSPPQQPADAATAPQAPTPSTTPMPTQAPQPTLQQSPQGINEPPRQPVQ